MGTFSADITEWCQLTKLTGAQVMRSLAFQAFNGIMVRSIVDTGRFRASNRISVNRVDTTVAPERPRTSKSSKSVGDPPSGEELSYANGVIARIAWEDTVHLSNSLPYAKPLEDKGSKQNGHLPDGIYGATATELQFKLDQAVRFARSAARNGGGL